MHLHQSSTLDNNGTVCTLYMMQPDTKIAWKEYFNKRYLNWRVMLDTLLVQCSKKSFEYINLQPNITISKTCFWADLINIALMHRDLAVIATRLSTHTHTHRGLGSSIPVLKLNSICSDT